MTGIMLIWAHPGSKSISTSPPSSSPLSSREQRLPQRRQCLLVLTVLVMWLTTMPGVHGQTQDPLQSSFSERLTPDIQSSGDISQTGDITPDLTNVFTSPSVPTSPPSPLEVSSAGRSQTQPDMDHSIESSLPREKSTVISDNRGSVTLQSSSRQSSPDIDDFSSGPFGVLTRKTSEPVAETTVRLDSTSGVIGTVLDINSLQTKDTPITDVLSTVNGGREASSSQVQTESIDGELLRTFSATEPIESSLHFSVESNQTLTPVASALKLLTTRPHSSLGLHIGSTDSVLTLSDSALTRDAKTAFSTGLLSTPQIQTQLGQSESSSVSLQTVSTVDTNQQTSASFLRAMSQSKSQNYQSYFETQDKSQIPSDVQMRSDITNSETALPLTLLQTLLFSDLNEHNTWKESAGSDTVFTKTLPPTDSFYTDMEISNSAGIADTIDPQSRHRRATLGSDTGSLQDQTPGLQVHVTSGLLVGGSLLHSSPDLTSSIEPTPASDFLMSATATPELMTFSAKPQSSSLPSNTLSNPQSDVPSLSPSPTVRDEEPRFGDSSSLPDSQASMEVWFDASHEFSSHTISQTETFSSSIRSSNSHSVRDIEILTPSFSLDVSFQSRNHVSFQVTTSLFQTTEEHLFVTKSTSSALNDFDFSTLNPRDLAKFSHAFEVHESSFLPQETIDDSKSTMYVEASVSYSNTQTLLDSTLVSLEEKNFLNSTKVPNLPLLTGDTDIFSSGQTLQFTDYSSKASLEVNNPSQNLSLYPTTDFFSQEMLYSHQSEILQTPNLPEASIDTTLVKISQGVSSIFVSDLSSVLMSDSPALEMSLIPEHYSNASFPHQSEMLLTPSLPEASIDTRVVEISQDISSQFVSDLSSGQMSNSPALEMSLIPEYYSTTSFSHQSKILRTPSLTEVPIDATLVEISQDISSQFVSDFRSLPMSASPALEMSLIPEHYSIASFASDKESVSLTMSQLDLETPISLGNYISSTNVNLDLQSNGTQKDESSSVVLSYSENIEIEHTAISTLSTELSSSYLGIFSISGTSMIAETASVTTSNSDIQHLMPSFTSMPSYNFGSTMSASVYTEFSIFTPETVSLTTENLTSSSPDLSTMLHKSTRSIIDGTTANVTDDLNSQISLLSTKINESVSMMSNTVSNYYNESVKSATKEYFVTPSSSSGIEMMTSQTTIPAEELESLKLTSNQSFSLHPSLTESMILELTSTAKNIISLLPDISTVMVSPSSVVDEFATENFNINMTPPVLPSSDVFLNLNITEVSSLESFESTPVFIDGRNTSETPIGLPTTRINITSFGDVGSASFNASAVDMFNTVQNSYSVSENSVSTVDKVFMPTLTTIDADAMTAISDVSNSMYITLFPTGSSSNETVINITPSQSNQDTSYAMNTFQFLSPSSVVESHSVDERYSYASEVDILSFVSDHPSSFPMPYTANNSAMQTTQLNMEEISTFPTVFPTPEMFSTIYNATVTFEESMNTASASQTVDFLLPSQLNSTNTVSVYPDSVSALPTDFSTAFLDQASSDIIENNSTVDLFLNISGFSSSSVMLTPSSSLLTENATEFFQYTETLVPSSPTSVYDSGQYITLSPSFASLSNETLNSDSLMANIPTDKMTHTPTDLFPSSPTATFNVSFMIESISGQPTTSVPSTLGLVSGSFNLLPSQEEPIQSSTFDSHSPSSTVTLDLFSGNSSSNTVFSDIVNETAETSSPGMVSFSTLSPNFTEVLQSDLIPASSAPGENSTAPPLDKTLAPSEVSMVISATEISSLLPSNVTSEVLPLLSQDGNIFNSTTPTPSISISTDISFSTLVFSENVTTNPGPVVVSLSTVEYSTASSPEPSPNGTQVSVLQQSEATSSFLAFPESPTFIESMSATQTLVSRVMFDSVTVFEPVTSSSVQPDYSTTTANLSKSSNSEFSELSLDTTASSELFTSVGTSDVTVTPSITDLAQTTLTLVSTQSESLMPVSDITVGQTDTSSTTLTLSLMSEFSSENSAVPQVTDTAVLPSTSLASSSVMETVSVTLSPIETTPVLTEISTILALTASETSSVTATMAQSTPITELPSVAVGETSMLSILSSMSLIVSSVTPTMPIASSTLAPTPTLPPDTTTPPADNNLNNTDFWVITGIRVRSSVNVSSERFLTPIERGLANAYYVARNIRNGTVVPLSRLRKRRRRKRATSADADPNIKVDIVSATRQADNPTNVDIVHVVEENGQLLTGAQATDQLKLLSDQELAIQLGHVVAVSAKPYVQEEVTTSEPKTDDENGNTRTLIIIGSVVGAAIFGVVFVTVLCICCWGNKRCCKRNAKSYEEEDDEDEEGGSVGVGPGGKQRARGGNVITDIVREVKVIDGAGKNSPEYVQDTPSKSGPLAMNPRKGKYSVTASAPEQEEEPLYAQVESSPTKKKATQAKLVTSAAADAKDTPSRRKKKKKLDTEDDIRSAYENQIASLAATSGSEGGFTINDHPTVEEESELLENAEAERKKNKHRLREKKLRESGGESPVKKGDATSQAYENAQREIDKVLAPKIIAEDQDEDSDGSGKKKKKKSKDKDKKKKKEKHKGEENGGYSSEEKVEESLEEAKAKMHQLLDDAFSLFSHSRSSMGNKVAPAKQSSEEKESPKPKKKRSPRSESASNKSSPREGSGKTSPREEEKKHTPMHIVRSHEPYDSSGLISWDPYKASDETAIISLPTTQTNLSSRPPQQEKLTTSTFTESLPGSLRPNYYATQPAEPIIIRSSELGDPNRQPPAGKDYYTSPRNTLSSPATGGNDAAYQQRLAAHHGMFQNPLYDESLAQAHSNLNTQPSGVRAGSRHAPPYHQQPARTVRDSHYEPYYGMSSYQEIPQTSTIPGQADHNPHRYREASTLNGIGTLDYSNPTYSNQHYEMAVRPYSENLPSARRDSIRDSREGGEVMSHTAPQRGENPNIDVVDAVSGSLRPGVSPQPLINSLREELQMLASRKGTKGLNNTAPSGGANSSLSNNGGHSLR